MSVRSEKQPSFPKRRLDKAPRPEQGYPATPEHEQLERELHHDGPPTADADDDEPATIRNDQLPTAAPEPAHLVDALADTARYDTTADEELDALRREVLAKSGAHR